MTRSEVATATGSRSARLALGMFSADALRVDVLVAPATTAMQPRVKALAQGGGPGGCVSAPGFARL